MTVGTRPSIECLGTPAQVWATLSGDQRTEVIAALARLAVHWLRGQSVPQRMPCWKEVPDVPRFDPSQNPARAS